MNSSRKKGMDQDLLSEVLLLPFLIFQKQISIIIGYFYLVNT